MFTKVLIADDLGSINKGVFTTLKNLGIECIDQVQYCDDAILKMKVAIKANAPYNLVITDLSFKTDHRKQKIASGEVLSKVLKKEYPEVKVIVYYIEDRVQKVRTLVKDYQVDAFVCKGRRGLEELADAIAMVFENKKYLSPQVIQAASKKTILEIEDYDIELLKQLASGKLQDEISVYFKKKNIAPSSLSAIEKRIALLRTHFKAKNVTHLVALTKDLGLI